jgi:hypothetical protein
VSSSWAESSALTIEVFVADLLDETDSYWISPRKLGESISEMEALAWAAEQKG